MHLHELMLEKCPCWVAAPGGHGLHRPCTIETREGGGRRAGRDLRSARRAKVGEERSLVEVEAIGRHHTRKRKLPTVYG